MIEPEVTAMAMGVIREWHAARSVEVEEEEFRQRSSAMHATAAAMRWWSATNRAGQATSLDGDVAMVLRIQEDTTQRASHRRWCPRRRTSRSPLRSETLTGIMNWWRFDELFKQEWGQATRDHLPISLRFVTLEDFEAFNDTYGYLLSRRSLPTEFLHQNATSRWAKHGISAPRFLSPSK